MDYQEALSYIESIGFFGSKPGLDRIRDLLKRLDCPHRVLKAIHVAGTNGKGSCASMLASILKASGYRTGLYTSPYLFRFNERIQMNGEQIPDEALADIVSRLRSHADAMDDHPTEFELITAAAFLWYAEVGCDILVLETGLGGRYDATNIMEATEASVIMNIGLDHTAVLGNTVEQIAWEKAGIIKRGCPCVLYEQSAAVETVIREECEQKDAPLTIASFSALESEFDSLEGQVFSYKGKRYALPLLGDHQLRNAAVALETVSVLRTRGWQISEEALEHGLYAAAWPGRFELLSNDPFFVVDGGHNPQCAQTVADNLLRYFPDRRRILLIGVLADKDYAQLTEILDPAADEYICVSPDSERALPAETLASCLARFGKPVQCFSEIPAAVEEAKTRAEKNGMACAVGSLYLTGPVRACFGLYE